MKLISMTDFVLQICNEFNTSDLIADKCFAYANFLKQPITLGMFVPCDDNGNILEEPCYVEMLHLELDKNDYNQLNEVFELAKSKVIFEGFIFSKNIGEIYFLNHLNRIILFNKNIEQTIESFIDHNFDLAVLF